MSERGQANLVCDRAAEAVVNAKLHHRPNWEVVYSASASFGNLALAIREDEDERRARQPPIDDEGWF